MSLLYIYSHVSTDLSKLYILGMPMIQVLYGQLWRYCNNVTDLTNQLLHWHFAHRWQCFPDYTLYRHKYYWWQKLGRKCQSTTDLVSVSQMQYSILLLSSFRSQRSSIDWCSTDWSRLV